MTQEGERIRNKEAGEERQVGTNAVIMEINMRWSHSEYTAL